MRASLPLAVALLVGVSFAGIAAAENGTVTLASFERQDVLSLSLKAGEVVEIDWQGTTSVEFSVERVGGPEVFDLTGQVGDSQFTVPSDGTYVFRIRNTSWAPSLVTWTVTRPNPGLWILAALVVLLVLILLLGLIARQRRTRAQRPSQWPMMPPR